MCIEIAQKLIIVFGKSQSSSKCKAFSSWLVYALEYIIEKAKKCNGSLNAEQFLSKYSQVYSLSKPGATLGAFGQLQ